MRVSALPACLLMFLAFAPGLPAEDSGAVNSGAVNSGAVNSGGGDWPQFRGPNGVPVATEAEIPLTWSEEENLQWKRPLPGPGSSSPIVVGDRVFLTSYSGYGTGSGGRGGSPAGLKRHLHCINRADGALLWEKTIPAEMPEDEYSGFLGEHGYATNTPVCDGEQVYVFFGKSGVFAFDLEGNEKWRVAVGKESSSRRWGSAASLILYKDILVVNAAEESRSVRGLNRKTGEELWKAEADMLENCYGTPSLAMVSEEPHLVLAVPGEVWGLHAETGKLRWYVDSGLAGNISPSPVIDGDIAYVFGGIRSAGSKGVKLGGKGDMTRENVVWSSRNSSYVATPVLHDGHLYWVDDRGTAWCLEAKTGREVYRERVPGLQSGGRPVYASPVVVRDRIYLPTRWNGTLVLPAKPSFSILAQNKFASDTSDFNATPAISGNQMFLRSDKALYCIAGE